MRILSGIKPTARPHLGNYLGAMLPHTELQSGNECFYMIADLHALTIPFDPRLLKQNVIDLAIDMLAVGYDPDKSTLFIQSHVQEHAELTWIFNCLIPVPELERMIEYKEMIAQYPKNANVGLLDYPVLQATDILMYHPDVVPVGKDQVQHLELTNTIVGKFNRRFGNEYFTKIKPLIHKETAKIMALTKPDKKMSKSLGEANFIGLTDEPDVIRAKVAKAVTDTGPNEGRMSKGVENLFSLLLAANHKEDRERLMKEYERGTLKYVDLKEAVASAMADFLAPIRERRRELEKDPESALQYFKEGSERAREVARKTMEEVREIVGLRDRVKT